MDHLLVPVEHETCGKCGNSIKDIAVAHLRNCFLNGIDSPSFAYVQDVENEQLICLDCCESDKSFLPYSVKDDMDVTLN